MKLSDLITEAQRLAGRVDPAWYTRCRRWINEAQEEWAISVPWPQLLEEERFIATGSDSLMLPSRVKSVMWVADEARRIPLIKSDFFEREIPYQFLAKTTGSPYLFREMGLDAVSRQPMHNSYLSVQASATDSTSVYIAGLTLDTSASGTADEYTFAHEVLTITDNSLYTTTNQYARVDSISKDALTAGDYTIKDIDHDIVVAKLNRGEYHTGYRHLTLSPIPAVGTAIYVQYLSGPNPLFDPNQSPHPAVDREYLIWYTAAMIHKAQSEEQQANTCLARAAAIVERRIYKERMFGDKDIRAMPDPNYWNDEDQYQVPSGGGGV